MNFKIIFSISLLCLVNSDKIREIEKNLIDTLFQSDRHDYRIIPEVEKYSAEDLIQKTKVFDFQNEENSIETIINQKINGSTNAIIDTIDVYLRYIHKISTIKQTLEIQITFRQKWKDSKRIYWHQNGKLSQINLSPDLKIWKPDLFISNEIEGEFHNVLAPNTLLRLSPNGEYLYSVRITVKVFCPMDLKNYPFDQQICSIKIASYGHTTDDIILKWKDGDPFQVSQLFKNRFVNHMKLTKAMTGYCTAKTNTGEYSCLKIDFQFERNSRFYICRWFVSSFICVLIVWLSFWLSTKHSKLRLGLIIGSTLMMSCISNDIKNNKPELDYCTTVDIWTMSCWLLIIFGYIQFGLIQYFNQKRKNDTKEFVRQEDGKENEILINGNKIESLRKK